MEKPEGEHMVESECVSEAEAAGGGGGYWVGRRRRKMASGSGVLAVCLVHEYEYG